VVLFLSILARERIVGWYHTGPKLHKNDIAINELMKQYCSNSVCNTVHFNTKFYWVESDKSMSE